MKNVKSGLVAVFKCRIINQQAFFQPPSGAAMPKKF